MATGLDPILREALELDRTGGVWLTPQDMELVLAWTPRPTEHGRGRPAPPPAKPPPPQPAPVARRQARVQ